MKRNELKAIIKECLKEALIEEGLLSGIISEVVKGLSPTIQQSTNSNPVNPSFLPNDAMKKHVQELNELKKDLSHKKEESFPQKKNEFRSMEHNAMSPATKAMLDDPGVELSALKRLVGDNWKKHMKKV